MLKTLPDILLKIEKKFQPDGHLIDEIKKQWEWEKEEKNRHISRRHNRKYIYYYYKFNTQYGVYDFTTFEHWVFYTA